MGAGKHDDETSLDRRRLFGAAGVAGIAAAAARLGVTGGAKAAGHSAQKAAGKSAQQAADGAAGKAGPPRGFGPLKQVRAGVLDVGYADVGRADGPVVICMHGWPYDIHSYVEVAPLLAAAGYRVIVPYFRGHGTTTFLDSATPRTGQQSAVAVDIIALMDALHIETAVLAGYDWGSRTADIIAALWPRRCKALVSVAGYLITNLTANLRPLPAKAEWAWWYQYYFCLERGVLGLTQNRDSLAQLVWTFNSPTWTFSQATFDQTATAFTNPDYVDIVISNYRWRLSQAPSDPKYARIEDKLQHAPAIAVPTITIDGQHDPFTPPGNGSAYRDHFTGKYRHLTLPVGHNVPQEAPRAFAEAVIAADHL
jgi:pimeloyl-ACP methyl ester carboxylesterase